MPSNPNPAEVGATKAHDVSVLPDVVVIGPMRTATTWVDEYLRLREDVTLPAETKETFFFDRHFEKGLGWYAAHFPEHRGPAVEVGSSYFHHAEAPARIADTLGRPRLVALLRDPVERSISHFRHLHRFGLAEPSIRTTAEHYPEVLEASRYASVLQRWERVFGAGAVALVLTEQLESDPEEFAQQLCGAFGLPYREPAAGLLNDRVYTTQTPRSSRLARGAYRVSRGLRGVRAYWVVEVAKRAGAKRLLYRSKADAAPAVSEQEREALRRMFYDEVVALESRTGLDLSHWKSAGTVRSGPDDEGG